MSLQHVLACALDQIRLESRLEERWADGILHIQFGGNLKHGRRLKIEKFVIGKLQKLLWFSVAGFNQEGRLNVGEELKQAFFVLDGALEGERIELQVPG